MIDITEAKRILAVFEREGVQYVMVGSMAMAAQGLVRATRDVDFFVSPARDTVRPQDRLDAERLRQLFNLEER